jgi:hypothetical protein
VIPFTQALDHWRKYFGNMFISDHRAGSDPESKLRYVLKYALKSGREPYFWLQPNRQFVELRGLANCPEGWLIPDGETPDHIAVVSSAQG